MTMTNEQAKAKGWKLQIEHPELFEDGDQYLVAVPVRNNRIDKNKVYWEYSVITIHCDEGRFSVTLDGESWGWTWEDVEFYIPLTRFTLASMQPPPARASTPEQ